MPPVMTDEQIRADEAALQSAIAYNQILGDVSRGNHSGPALANIAAIATAQQRLQLTDWARRTYGDQAAADMQRELNRGTLLDPVKIASGFTEQYPRLDAAPAVPAAPSPAPPVPVAASSPEGTPGDGRKWLPGNATLPELSDEASTAIDRLDAAIEAHNTALFGVDANLAWFPDGARLPVTGTNISTLGGAFDKAGALIPKWRTRIEQLRSVLEGSGEYLINQQLDTLRAPITALSTAAQDSRLLNAMIAAAGVAANDAFHQLRGEALDKRNAIGEIVSTREGRIAEIPAVAERLDKADNAIRIGRDIGALADKIPAPTTPAAPVTATPTSKTTVPAATATPTAGAAPAGRAPASSGSGAGGASSTAGSGGTKGGDDLAKLLSTLGSAAAQVPNPAQAMAPLAQAAQQAAKPLAQAAEPLNQAVKAMPEELLKALRGGDAANDRLTGADAASRAADADREAATSATVTLPGPAPVSGLGVPGSDARPHQLDATGKPVDRDGDGKVDKGAVPLSRKTVTPFDLTVPVDGANVRVAGVGDPRLGEMMLNMAAADEGKPVSVLEAAKAAGMDIGSLGDPLDPGEARTGDAVIGTEKSGIYLGEGRVLTSTGEVAALDDVVGDDGFVAAIPLPELPEDAPTGDPAQPATTPSSAGGEPLEPLAPQPPGPAQDVTPAHAEPDAPPPPADPGTTPAPEPAPPAAPAPAPTPPATATPAPESPAPAAPSPQTPPRTVPVSAESSALASTANLPRQVGYEGRALG